ncbi:hypothetical protein MRX96_004279 [Rhipicephalus microplus]
MLALPTSGCQAYPKPSEEEPSENGPHHRTWTHSRRSGHYSDLSSVYTVCLGTTSTNPPTVICLLSRSAVRRTPVASASLFQAFYGDLPDMSQHSSSSYGYDQRILLVAPLPGKYQITPLAHVFHQGLCLAGDAMLRHGPAVALWL